MKQCHPLVATCHISLLLQCHLLSRLYLVSFVSWKKRCISLTSHAKSTSSLFTENQEAGPNSLSAIKVIIRENEETVFPQKEKFSQWYIKALDLGKDCLSVKYVIVFQTWRRSWELGGDDVNNKQYLMTWTTECDSAVHIMKMSETPYTCFV